MQVHVLHYDAFSSVPNLGNPAGVVLAAGLGLTDDVMQAVALAVGFNETAFVTDVNPESVSIRYFTPGHEGDLCGHATVAAFAALHDRGHLPPSNVGPPWHFTLHARAGNLPVLVERDEHGRVKVWMAQPAVRFVPVTDEPSEVARVLGLRPQDISCDLPVIYANTGLWTLLVPVTGLDAMKRMRPDNAAFPAV